MANNYDWDYHNPPEIAAHSLVKQQLLQSYIEKYVQVLTRVPGQEVLNLSIVDGFSGGGKYLTPNGTECAGSPLVTIRAVKAAEAIVNSNRHKPIHVKAEYHFIDEDQSALEMLRMVLRDEGLADQIGETIYLHHGAYVDHHVPLLRHIRARTLRSWRAIYILDQYAYSDVPLPFIKTIFDQLNHPEVILTFGQDLLINYLTNDDRYRGILTNIGWSSDNAHEFSQLKNEGSNWKRKAQAALYGHIWKHSGASHFTPFFIRAEKSRRAYWLVHLSNHFKARDVMTELHWEKNNSFQHFGGAGLNMLGFDALKVASENQIAFEFDQAANVLTGESLLADLPVEVFKRPRGATFETLLNEVANFSPATRSQFEEAVVGLRNFKELEVLNQDGSIRPRTKTVKSSDIIRPAKQHYFKY